VHTLTVLGIDGRSVRPTAPVRDLLDAAGVAVSVGLLGLVLEGATGPTRILLTLAFAFFAPGRAIVTNWPRFAYWSEFGMSVVLSLATLTLLATVTLWAHEWHPVGLFQVEAAVAAVALFIGVIRRHRGDPGTPDLDEQDGVDLAIPDLEPWVSGSQVQPLSRPDPLQALLDLRVPRGGSGTAPPEGRAG
jgi:hypothetical protein